MVDKKNSAGYGENAFVAAFTSYDEQTKKQSQSIAFSRDGGVSYQYYDLNPVIDIWSTEFRDTNRCVPVFPRRKCGCENDGLETRFDLAIIDFV